ncbi:MAG: tetratricopeptide repeat protein, partial [Synechococcaceae cyanobacterium]|nr:tetratricopeptide repeat protein [Synechococcaceae cyanobacterium]
MGRRNAHLTPLDRANTLKQAGRLVEAAAAYQEALRLNPEQPAALNNLGNTLKRLDRLVEAIPCYLRALAIAPHYAEAHNNLGNAYQQLGDRQRAIDHYRQALAADPNLAVALSNLGIALQVNGNLGESLELYRRAIALEPAQANAWCNLGHALKQSGDLEQAEQTLRRAVGIAPDHHDAHWNLALCLLLRGNYVEGWDLYEWRLRKSVPPLQEAASGRELWDGQAATANGLLLMAEQGLGDTLQFMRYATLLSDSQRPLTFCVPKSLQGLVIAAGVADHVIVREELPACNASHWLPLLSLPRLLAVSAENPRLQQPYLSVPEPRLKRWREQLQRQPELLVGLHWQGNPEAETLDLNGRSFPLETLAPLAAIEGVRFVALQKGAGSEQLSQCSFRDRFVEAQDAVSDCWDFQDCAAIVASCDLVISNDSAVVHLAGALGVPTWLLLQQVPDWRWGSSGSTCGWYPTVRLFRQHHHGHWPAVVAELEANLRERLSSWQRQFERAKALQDRGDAEAAEALYRQLLARGPRPPQLLCRLAVLCGSSGRIGELQQLSEQTLAIAPDHAEAHFLQGYGLEALGDDNAAAQCYRTAISLRSPYPEAHLNLSLVLRRQGALAEAFEHACLARAQRPTYAAALIQLGMVSLDIGNVDSAICFLRHAWQQDPNDQVAGFNLAHALLMAGAYEEAWPLYKLRFTKPGPVERNATPSSPAWDGNSPLPAEGLLLVSEQGLGDTLQFCRYARSLKRRYGPITLAVPPKLVALIEQAELADRVVSTTSVDGQATQPWLPLLSVPQLLQVSPNHCVEHAPYLKVPSKRIQTWRQRLKADDPEALVIGLNWQGNPAAERLNLQGRSLPLEQLAPLAELPGVRFVALQKGAGSEQRQTCSFRDRFVSCQAQVDRCWEFSECAAISAACDLVISTDTSAAHLAGAIGCPTWLLLQFIPDWRWGIADDRSHWYESMKLFRQPARGDWAAVVAQVKQALEELLQQRGALEARRQEADQQLLHGELQQAAESYSALAELGCRAPTLFANWAAVLQMQGRYAESAPKLSKALLLDDQCVAAWSNLGNAHKQLGDRPAAAHAYSEALQIDPHHSDTLNNLGTLHLHEGRLEEAISHYERVLQLAPDKVDAHLNLGYALKQAGRHSEAREAYNTALAINPNDADSRWNRGILELQLGNYAEGWDDYEWGFRRRQNSRQLITTPPDHWPRWQADASSTKALVLIGEQGLGDVLQFCRYARVLRSQVGLLTLCVQHKLVALLQEANLADAVISPEQLQQLEPQPWLPLLSVPGSLGVSPEQVFVEAPYLQADAEQVAYWRQKLRGNNKDAVIIGVNWQGNPAAEQHLAWQRSFALETWTDLVDDPRV